MMRIALAVAIAAKVLTTAPLVSVSHAQVGKMAQVDMQGRHFDERDPASFYKERRRGYDANSGVVRSDATIGPQGHRHGALRPKRGARKR
jgi:hypothetical protein